MFPPLTFFGRVCTSSSLNVCIIHQLSHLLLVFSSWEFLKITTSIFLFVIDIFRLSISSGVSFWFLFYRKELCVIRWGERRYISIEEFSLGLQDVLWNLTVSNLVNNWSMFFFFFIFFIFSAGSWISPVLLSHHDLGIFSYWILGLEIPFLCVRIHQWHLYDNLYVQLAAEGEQDYWNNWLSQISAPSLNDMWCMEAPGEFTKCFTSNLRHGVRILYTRW